MLEILSASFFIFSVEDFNSLIPLPTLDNLDSNSSTPASSFVAPASNFWDPL